MPVPNQSASAGLALPRRPARYPHHQACGHLSRDLISEVVSSGTSLPNLLSSGRNRPVWGYPAESDSLIIGLLCHTEDYTDRLRRFRILPPTTVSALHAIEHGPKSLAACLVRWLEYGPVRQAMA